MKIDWDNEIFNTTLTDDTAALMREYIAGGWEQSGSALPTVAGMCRYAGTNQDYFKKAVKNERYSDIYVPILRAIKDLQEEILICGGVSGQFNSTITKLLLGKHGYTEKVEHDIFTTTEHGEQNNGMKPAVFEGVKANNVIEHDKGDNPANGLLNPPAKRKATYHEIMAKDNEGHNKRLRQQRPSFAERRKQNKDV